eukprot:6123593-Amphidinium_carterae.1
MSWMKGCKETWFDGPLTIAGFRPKCTSSKSASDVVLTHMYPGSVSVVCANLSGYMESRP